MSDLFEEPQKVLTNEQPLAARMRPDNLDGFMGQGGLLAPNALLRKAIEQDELSSLIFWGPPGCGKSTLASIIAHSTKCSFENFSAVTSGVPEMRKVIERARQRLNSTAQRTILFVDEIHRFNKAQQDALLPHVEDGTVILIGATTENPYFEVNSPLLSRARILKFNSLSADDLKSLLNRAILDKDRGLGNLGIVCTAEAIDHIVDVSEGDARSALNALETAAMIASVDAQTGNKQVDLAVAEQAVQKRVLKYDKNGDNHYDTISAYIKSMRGSDPDAAVFYLARMLSAGEDPKFIARRLVIQSAEDVGNADPMALVVATAAAQAVQFVGMPEAQIPLAQATIYLACAPKSNASYMAIKRANKDVADRQGRAVPKHLRDANYPGAKKQGHGDGYLYPHDYPGGYVAQEYMPDKRTVYYEPKDCGHEAKFKQRLERLQKIRDENSTDDK